MRPGWDEYFLSIARLTATRSTCSRKHVGCIIVVDRQQVSGGYNGSIAGLEHCDDIDHDMVNGGCVRTVHAEANAVALAARRGIALDGATAYVTTFPCWACFKLLAQAGIKRIVYVDPYRTDDPGAQRIATAASQLRIALECWRSEALQ